MEIKLLKSWLKLIRIYQWPKNILVFAVPFFAGKLGNILIVQRAVLAFVFFSCVASFVYILNDITDLQSDRFHPKKRLRPLASGEISVQWALPVALLFAVVGFAGGFYFLPSGYGIILIVYVLINTGYSFYFKNVAPLDVFCVSSGYIFRIVSGGYAVSISVSPWLFLTGFWVALYIAFSKRFSDIQINRKSEALIRQPYRYNRESFLFGAMVMSGASCLMTYGIYTLESDRNLILTIIPASYGIFRYLIISTTGKTGDPLETFIKDRQIMISSFVFLGTIAWFLYA